MTSQRFMFLLFLSLSCVAGGLDANDGRVFPAGELPDDVRLQPLKDLNGYFPFEVPETKEQWQQRAEELRRQVLVATGLWPMPERTPMKPVIHGLVQRDGFTVEKVYFESMPNHFVTGLLFRPDDGKQDVKRPAVLCPHGHGGRLQDYGEKKIRELIAGGAERFESSGRFPKLARCAHLARMGCVTFIFDMLGYADSQQLSYDLAHRYKKSRPDFEGSDSWGLYSAQAEMRLQSIMGIQTWNAVRCLDFLQQLPDVDPNRIGVTGGSGGGTQTILLCAIDDRPIVAFPNGMVSTSMQGGCTCENCSLLRIGTGNVELAALFAPKPQAMTAAEDWTREMMTKGYPQLQQVYAMTGKKGDVYCRDLLHFPHNFNYVSRATMYKWFNRYLELGHADPFLEEDFPALTVEENAVWNDGHPQPEGGDKYERELTRYMADVSDRQLADMRDQEYATVAGAALSTIVGRDVPSGSEVKRSKVVKEVRDGYIYFEDILRLDSYGEELPAISLYPTTQKWNGHVVIWVDGNGKRTVFGDDGNLSPVAQEILHSGATVLSADLFGQGEFLKEGESMELQRVVENPREAAAYSFCYNNTLLIQRVHDLMTLIGFAGGYEEEKPDRVSVMATGDAAPIGLVCRTVADRQVSRWAFELGNFSFSSVKSYRAPSFLPGVIKYGDVAGMLRLGDEDGIWPAHNAGTVDDAAKWICKDSPAY